ncbi:MAG: hypothetical protein LAT84_06785 [Balneolia bacterium]|nr:hypothetical protein [Balneolia bacterium]
MNKKYIIPVLAGFTFLLGLAALTLPFLPIGWPLMAITALLVMPYFKKAQKGFSWIADKDSSGLLLKGADAVIELYHWADEDKKADEIDDAVNGD